MKYSTLIFDLDETLYPSSSGLWIAIRNRIEDYMATRMHFNRDEIPEIRRALFTRYGTTLRGLQHEYLVDEYDYLAFVHDVPLSQYIEPSDSLSRMLSGYAQRKIVFTNADRPHAERVLRCLKIEQHFEDIIDIHSIKPHCKPEREAFETALRLAGCLHPEQCVMIDDSRSNLLTARTLGMHTIQVGGRAGEEPWPDAIASIQDLATVLAMEE